MSAYESNPTFLELVIVFSKKNIIFYKIKNNIPSGASILKWRGHKKQKIEGKKRLKFECC